MEDMQTWSAEIWQRLLEGLTQEHVYIQIGLVLAAWLIGWVIAALVMRRVKVPQTVQAPLNLGNIAGSLEKLRELIPPFLITFSLAIAERISEELGTGLGLLHIALGISVVILIRSFVHRFIANAFILALVNYVAVPAAILQVLGVLDDVVAFLESVAIQLGNIKLTAYAIVRTVIFGSILFYIGRISNSTGKRVIRSRQELDARTRELATKLFEILLFVVISLLLLQIIGINLTTLAVFGGAIGVGLGFGLQSIASNFISGIIILLDKSITIGDFIELEDGRSGTLKDLSMRSAMLETYDGKVIMVPNETFISSSFVNWTHHDTKQRYDIRFSVAYDTDIEAMIDIVREVVQSHPQVISGENASKAEQPDAEIESFGDNGIDILVEFWMEGVDDGPNRVGADLNLMIWTALKQNGIVIPFPQREVRMLGDAQKN
ncbi:mechanosensitive ion channel family protein [Parvularcula bermudensis HTCC2503]|uniref:Mechanosensitive ion channel family protein n=2 Tax=Parvularcula TaxID=208215 RepID=E0TC95_PARBH|nr:mechanosensitive ion channel family protein [Parvularcula bermudensis HTCC2503]